MSLLFETKQQELQMEEKKPYTNLTDYYLIQKNIKNIIS